MIRINPKVVSDLKQIKTFIANDSPKNAEHVLQKIYEKFETIDQFPNIGTELAKRVSFKTNYRYVIWNNYIIIYLKKTECVEIYRILNGRQDITQLLE